MFKKFRPLFDRILIERIETVEEKTAGGIIIPDAAKEKAQTGRVIAVGNGRVTTEGHVIPCQVKVGDMVFFSKYAGTEAGDTMMVIREEEVLGIIEQ